MPAYQEGDLSEFVAEIERHLARSVRLLEFVIVDDASPEPVLVQGARHEVRSKVTVLRNDRNRGHGPTALEAYRRGCQTGAEFVVHVDGDGQFHGRDVARVLRGLRTAEVVHGERWGRSEPWFRRLLTLGLRTALVPWIGSVRDVNTPLRGYRVHVLRRLVESVHPDSLVPHVHFTCLLARETRLEVAFVPVESLCRRGDSPTGSSWGSRPWSRFIPSRRLLTLCWGAAGELVSRQVVRRAPLLSDACEVRAESPTALSS